MHTRGKLPPAPRRSASPPSFTNHVPLSFCDIMLALENSHIHGVSCFISGLHPKTIASTEAPVF